MGAGNMGGGGGPKLNAKNQGAFAPGGGMGRPNPGNGGGNGMVRGLGIQRDRWQGMTPQQRAGWRDMRQAGGGGAGAFATQQATAAQNTMPPVSPPATDGAANVPKQGDSGALAALIAANPGIAEQLGGSLTSLMGKASGPMSGAASQNTGAPSGVAPEPGTTGPDKTPPAAGAFAPQQRQEPRTGLGGMDANWWKQVGYSPYAVSQLPGMLANAGGLNRGYSPVNDWNNPNQIRRAIQSLPMDMSRYANNGRAMGMNFDPKTWGNWKPGRFQGVGPAMDFPNPDLVNGGG